MLLDLSVGKICGKKEKYRSAKKRPGVFADEKNPGVLSRSNKLVKMDFSVPRVVNLQAAIRI